MSDAVVRRWTLRRWLTERGVVRRRRRRLGPACRGRLAQRELSRPYAEGIGVKPIQERVGWPINVIDLTEDVQHRLHATCSGVARGHGLATSDGHAIAVDPRANADSLTLAIPYELVYTTWSDLCALTDAPSLEAFFRSQGEDVPDVVRFMLSGSGASRL